MLSTMIGTCIGYLKNILCIYSCIQATREKIRAHMWEYTPSTRGKLETVNYDTITHLNKNKPNASGSFEPHDSRQRNLYFTNKPSQGFTSCFEGVYFIGSPLHRRPHPWPPIQTGSWLWLEILFKLFSSTPSHTLSFSNAAVIVLVALGDEMLWVKVLSLIYSAAPLWTWFTVVM